MAIGMTAAMVIEQIYRELEVDLTDATRYYTGDFTMKHLATAWLVAASQVQKLVRRSDIQNFVSYGNFTINSSLQVYRSSVPEYYAAISAFVGDIPVIISPPGQLLDRKYWNDSNGASGITLVETDRVLQLRGNVTAGQTLEICYQRRLHPPVAIDILSYTSASTTVEPVSGGDLSYRDGVYDNAQLFYMATTYANKTIASSTTGGLVLTANAGFTSIANESVIFALPELPVDYIDPMIALACLYLMGGEDLNGWRERSQMLSAMPRLHRPSTPRAHTRGLFDADSR